MKKNRWLFGIAAAVLLSGCGVRNYQMERAEAVLGSIFTGNADKKEDAGGKEEEIQEETSTEEAAAKEQEKASVREQEKVSTEASGKMQTEEENRLSAEGAEEISANNENNETLLQEAAKPPADTRNTETQKTDAEKNNAEKNSAEKNDVQKNDVQNTEPQDEISYKTKYVINCKKSITLREAPSTSAARIDDILWGEPVSFIKDDVNGFSKVAYLGKTGYVLAAYLGESAPAEDERPASENAEAVRVQFDYFIENGRECADVIGLDSQNQQVWKYEVRSSHEMTELEAVQEIGIVGDSYYLNEDGTIVALTVKDGKVRWKNTDFGGASVSFAVDEQGTLYLCGYYGPDLCIINHLGTTITRIDSFSPELQWPYEVRCMGEFVYVTCTRGGADEVIVRYDQNTGEISY